MALNIPMDGPTQGRDNRAAVAAGRLAPLNYPQTPQGVVDRETLNGFTVGIVASRRRRELTMAFQRRGARVMSAEAIDILPLVSDPELEAMTRECAARPPQVLVATTGIGFRAWMEAADAMGIGELLRAKLALSEIIARGPKAAGAVRAAGLSESWLPPSESMAEVMERLEERDLLGCRIAIQLHGDQGPDAAARLQALGAEVLSIPVYRCAPPGEVDDGFNLVTSCAEGQVDALVFTSAPGVASLLQIAAQQGLYDVLCERMRDRLTSFCVGPVCAVPLREIGVPVVLASKGRLGALIRTVEEVLPKTQTISVNSRCHELEIKGHLVVMDGAATSVSPTSMAILRTLARKPGRVFTRAELASDLPARGGSDHAVEMAITRLRSQLGDPKVIETVFKRGYRLALPSAPRPGQSPA